MGKSTAGGAGGGTGRGTAASSYAQANNFDEAVELGNSLAGNWRAALSNYDENALRAWVFGTFSLINDALRCVRYSPKDFAHITGRRCLGHVRQGDGVGGLTPLRRGGPA